MLFLGVNETENYQKCGTQCKAKRKPSLIHLFGPFSQVHGYRPHNLRSRTHDVTIFAFVYLVVWPTDDHVSCKLLFIGLMQRWHLVDKELASFLQ